MSICIKLYTVLGKQEDFETKLRDLVERLRSKIKSRGVDPERINLVVVKVREEFVDEAVKYAREGGHAPDYLRGLVELMRRDGVRDIPALIVNNKKVSEGSLPDLSEVEKLLYEEVKLQFNIDLLRESTRTRQTQTETPGKVSERTQRGRLIELDWEEEEEEQERPEEEKQEKDLLSELEELEEEVNQRMRRREVGKPPETAALAERRMSMEREEGTVVSERTQAEELIDMSGEELERATASSPAAATESPSGSGSESTCVREEKVEVEYRVVLGEPSTCRDCIYYGKSTGYCFMLGQHVDNPEDPPCKRREGGSTESL